MSKPKNELTKALMALAGKENVIVVYRPFVEFTGSLEGGLLFSQLLYWTPRSATGGWVAKTDKEFSGELCITPYGLRTARAKMESMGILETKLKKFNNSPTVHYLLVLDKIESDFMAFILRNQQMDLSKTQNQFCENAKSLTEITSEININSIQADEISIFSPFENVFIEETKSPLFLGGPEKWYEGFKAIQATGITPEEFREVVRQYLAKGYAFAGPKSFVNWAINFKARQVAKPPAVKAANPKNKTFTPEDRAALRAQIKAARKPVEVDA